MTPPKVIDRFDGPYRFLSNFARLPDGLTLEHYYQAEKTITAVDAEWVLAASTPAVAKQRGRKVALKSDWDSLKNDVMLRLLRTKFATEPMRSMLLDTGDAPLTEGNTWHDQYWGNCNCPKHAGVAGENWLGKSIMQVREELRSDNANTANQG